MRNKTSSTAIVSYVLSEESWAKDPRVPGLIEELIRSRKAEEQVVYLLKKPWWAAHEKGMELLELVLRDGRSNAWIKSNILNQDVWQKRLQKELDTSEPVTLRQLKAWVHSDGPLRRRNLAGRGVDTAVRCMRAFSEFFYSIQLD